MSPNVAIIAADHYTLESGWQDELSSIASKIESNWNDEIADASYEEVSIDTPPISGHEDSVPTPSSDLHPNDYRDDVRSMVDFRTDLFQDYDSVVVRTTSEVDGAAGVAYIGDNDSTGMQAAGTDHGLGIVFDSPHPGLTAFHELLHTFSGVHSHGYQNRRAIRYDKNTVMCSYSLHGCDENSTKKLNIWSVSNCTENAVTDYMSTWGVY